MDNVERTLKVEKNIAIAQQPKNIHLEQNTICHLQKIHLNMKICHCYQETFQALTLSNTITLGM